MGIAGATFENMLNIVYNRRLGVRFASLEPECILAYLPDWTAADSVCAVRCALCLLQIGQSEDELCEYCAGFGQAR